MTAQLTAPHPPSRKQRSVAVWLWATPLLLLALLGPNTVLGLIAFVVLAIGLKLLWRPGEPSILLLIFIVQWLQSAGAIIYSNLLGIRLSRFTNVEAGLFPSNAAYSYAAGLMLIGVLVLTLSMRAGAGRQAKWANERLIALIKARPFSFWFSVYVMIFLLANLSGFLAPMTEGLKLPLLALSDLRWAGFLLLTFAALLSSESRPRLIWLSIFLLEIALGFGAYFSDFKMPFLYTLAAFSAVGFRFKPRQVLLGAALVLTVAGMSIVWTAIKQDYREFVSGGTRHQVVTVSYSESIDKIGVLIADLDKDKISLAVDTLARRVTYHEFFGVTASRVPAYLPYSGGEIWGEAISRPFMPRLLFPDKRAINDSDLTNQYTGLRVAGADQGTSISIGYMAEAYVDFGPRLMFAPIALLGLWLGLLNRWLVKQRGEGAVIGAALAPYALMPALLAETSILKMASTLVLTGLICLLIIKFVVPIIFRARKKRCLA